MPSYSTCLGCGKAIRRNVSRRCAACLRDAIAPIVVGGTTPISPEQQVQGDRDQIRFRAEVATYKGKYQQVLLQLEEQEAQLGWLAEIRAGIDQTITIEPREGSGTSEVTPIVLASDWHSEEIVTAAQVNGLNEFNLDIFAIRSQKFWQGTVRLLQMFNKDVKITTVVLALLGDFITNDIHDAENAESNALLPIDAIINVQNHIIGGLDFMLNHTAYELVIVCKVGNHSRTTKKVRHASEMGHSLESMMYVHLAAYYRNEPRIRFIIEDGYHTYLNIYDKVCRFHHGHKLQYQGGVGGLYIPARKAIAQWNLGRRADRDFFGHFHTELNDTSFTCNGSLIGFNAFAVAIKAAYEVPKQTMVLCDKRRGFTGRWPVILD